MSKERNTSPGGAKPSGGGTPKGLDPSLDYHALFLRLWRDDESSPWRVVLENAHTGEKVGFDSIKGIVDYLAGLSPQDG